MTQYCLDQFVWIARLSHHCPMRKPGSSLCIPVPEKMNVDKNDVNFEELARSKVDFNGAQMKAVCV